jgi:BspA type Leucine rich repeat region (6 copies)
VSIPGAIDGLPVTRIGDNAFSGYINLISVTISNCVASIGDNAFSDCTNLTNVYFEGNAPTAGSEVFSGDGNLTVYYVPTTTGWDIMFGGRPTVPSYSLVYTYSNNDGAITIIGYRGSGGAVTIPDVIDCLPVNRIGDYAFNGISSLTNVTVVDNVGSIGDRAFCNCINLIGVTIPNSVISIGYAAFSGCTSLTRANFQGDAPSIPAFHFINYYGPPLFDVFSGANNATVYYLSGTTNWGAMFGAFDPRPTMLWKPQMQAQNASFAVGSNQFGFDINWSSGQVIVVEACTNLTNPVWYPIQTNTLIGDSSLFSDPQWTNYSGRFYRVRSP